MLRYIWCIEFSICFQITNINALKVKVEDAIGFFQVISFFGRLYLYEVIMCNLLSFWFTILSDYSIIIINIHITFLIHIFVSLEPCALYEIWRDVCNPNCLNNSILEILLLFSIKANQICPWVQKPLLINSEYDNNCMCIR